MILFLEDQKIEKSFHEASENSIINNKKTPRQGIEPWFSDLESDVLTIERPRIRYSFPFYRLYKVLILSSYIYTIYMM